MLHVRDAIYCALRTWGQEGACGAQREGRCGLLSCGFPLLSLTATVYFVTSESPSAAGAASVSAPSVHLCSRPEANHLYLLFLCLNNLHILVSNILFKIGGRNFKSSICTGVDEHV